MANFTLREAETLLRECYRTTSEVEDFNDEFPQFEVEWHDRHGSRVASGYSSSSRMFVVVHYTEFEGPDALSLMGLGVSGSWREALRKTEQQARQPLKKNFGDLLRKRLAQERGT